MDKPTVFISYAHKDAMEWVRRWGFALSVYADVFWDIHLQAGPFPEWLKHEISTREFFLFVMTPYSQPEDGWCRRELKIAEETNRKIVLIRIYEQYRDAELEDRYTYADFAEDDDQGFRRLTYMILGEPKSSWEYLCQEPDHEVILFHLEQGYLPGLIAKAVGDWVIVDRLWPHLERRLLDAYPQGMFFATPRTPIEALSQFVPLVKQAAGWNNATLVHLLLEAKKIVEEYVKSSRGIRDTEHLLAGRSSAKAVKESRQFILKDYTLRIDAYGIAGVQGAFLREAADKIRELIAMHSRRSRYLY